MTVHRCLFFRNNGLLLFIHRISIVCLLCTCTLPQHALLECMPNLADAQLSDQFLGRILLVPGSFAR